MRISTMDGLSVALAKRIAEYDGGVDKYDRALAEASEARSAVLGDIEKTTVCELKTRIDGVHEAELELAQLKIMIVGNRGKLLAEMFAELESRVGTLKAVHDKTEKSVRRKLEAAGSGVESMPAFPGNVNAAQRQFDLTVRQNTEVQNAADAVSRCQKQIEHLRKLVADSEREVSFARDELTQTARQIIGLGLPKIQQRQQLSKAG